MCKTDHQYPILAVAKREFQRILQRRAFSVISFILPVVLFFLIGFIYINRVVTDLPVAVVDLDGSVMSRLLISSINSTKSLKIVDRLHSVEEVGQSLRRGEIQCAFIIPENFAQKILRGTPVTLVVYKNSVNLTVSNLLYKESQTIIQTFNGAIVAKKLKSRGMSAAQAMDIVNPIRLEISSLFNPGYNYQSFLVPGLLPTYLQLVITMLGALIFNLEFSEGSFKDLYRISGGNVIFMLVGKGLVHVGLQLVNALIILGVVFPVFGLEVKSSIWLILFFFMLFIVLSFLIGSLFSLIFKASAMSSQMAMIFNTPSLILSGLTFPAWAMPSFFRILSDVFPYTSFMLGFLKLCRQDLYLTDISAETVVLLTYLLVLFPVVLILLKYRTANWLKLSENKNSL